MQTLQPRKGSRSRALSVVLVKFGPTFLLTHRRVKSALNPVQKRSILAFNLSCLIMKHCVNATGSPSLSPHLNVGRVTSRLLSCAKTPMRQRYVATRQENKTHGGHFNSAQTDTARQHWTPASHRGHAASVRLTPLHHRTSSKATRHKTAALSSRSNRVCTQWRTQSYPLAGVLALLTGDPCAVGPTDLQRRCWCESAERRHWACV